MNLVERITGETPAVLFVSGQRIRSFGGATAVDLTGEADPEMAVAEAHRLATESEGRIRSRVEDVIGVRVRVDPAGAFVAGERAGWKHPP